MRTIKTAGFAKMGTHLLFAGGRLGGLGLSSRVVMTSPIRARASDPGGIANDLMAIHYAQRSSAGLIITEPAHISVMARGCAFTPGIYSEQQIEGWRQITSLVHKSGGRIFLQLVHAGRRSHESLLNNNTPLAPSAISSVNILWVNNGGMKVELNSSSSSRALTELEIAQTVQDFRRAARCAIEAGFDGVEINAGNGYLIDQFLRQSSNTRTDGYGGSQDNRMRFAVEVVEAVCEEIGPERAGVRLSPFLLEHGDVDKETITTNMALVAKLNQAGIAYIHTSEVNGVSAPFIEPLFRTQLRSSFDGAIMVGGHYSGKSARRILDAGHADFVAFGRAFIANPDLPYRLENNLVLNSVLNPYTIVGGGARGYTDYPVYAEIDWSTS